MNFEVWVTVNGVQMAHPPCPNCFHTSKKTDICAFCQPNGEAGPRCLVCALRVDVPTQAFIDFMTPYVDGMVTITMSPAGQNDPPGHNP